MSIVTWNCPEAFWIGDAARVGYFVPLNGPLNGHPPSFNYGTNSSHLYPILHFHLELRYRGMSFKGKLELARLSLLINIHV